MRSKPDVRKEKTRRLKSHLCGHLHSSSNPATFSALADAFLGALPTFRTEANALAEDVEADALTAENTGRHCRCAGGHCDKCDQRRLAASNYKDPWSTRSGAATVPYSVSHAGIYWMRRPTWRMSQPKCRASMPSGSRFICYFDGIDHLGRPGRNHRDA